MRGYYGVKEFDDPGPLYNKLKARAEKGKSPRTYKENPNGLEMLLRTILSSAFHILEGKNSTQSKAASQSASRRKDEYSRTPMGV